MAQQTARSGRRVALIGVLLAGIFAAGSATGIPHAMLALHLTKPAVKGRPYTLPVSFAYEDTTITALVFSIDVDTRWLRFNPADDDGDGVPDSVTLPSGTPSIVFVGWDPDDTGGELDVMLANLTGVPLPQGMILKVKFRPRHEGSMFGRLVFSDDPPASFGDVQGQHVDGTTVVFALPFFSDGFESGDTSAWSRTVTPTGGYP